MNHQQMAQMCYSFLLKAAITGADAEALAECKGWLQAIGSGQFRIAEQGQVITDAEEPVDPNPKANGEDASPDGPEGDAAPG